MSSYEGVPVIDLDAFDRASDEGRLEVARDLTRRLEDVGFLVVVGHGIAPSAFAELRESAARFFALDATEKDRHRPGVHGAPGYYPVAAGSLATTLGASGEPDLKESFTMGPLDRPGPEYLDATGASRWYPDDPWPEVDGMEESWSRLYRDLTRTAERVTAVFALGLDVEPEAFGHAFTRHTSTLSAIRYPPQPASAAGRLRASAHSDYGSLTLLHKEPTADPLEILGADGSWHPVVAPEGGLVVNIGDLLARWVNDRWVSTVHRVVAPSSPDDAPPGGSISIGYFHQPNHDAVIAPLAACVDAEHPLTGGTFVAGEHLAAKMARQHSTPPTPQPIG
ncbi:2-oxoglutarate and iron-dependent oxygenase domain-containing protein [soil metagenome]